MIRGRLNQSLEPVVNISVLDEHDIAHSFEFILDTGFNGHLSLPVNVIRRLGLYRSGQRTVTVADGSQHDVDVYWARVLLHEDSRTALVIQLDDAPLLGMGLLLGSRLSMNVHVGGDVVVEDTV